jgi:hypothetical protein
MNNLKQKLQWLDGASLCLLIVAMCSQIDAKTLGRDTLAEGLGYATKTVKLAIGDAIFALVVAYFVARCIQTKAWKRLWWPPLPCFALIFALIVSCLHSPTIFGIIAAGGKDHILPLREAIIEIIQWTGYFIIAPWVFVNLLLDKRDEAEVNRLDIAIRAFFFAVAASAIVAFIQSSQFTSDAPRGLWTSANIYGAFLGFSLPLLLEAESSDTRSQVRFILIGFVLIAAALITIVSIWALLALIIGLVAACLVRPGTPKTRIFRLGVIGLIVVAGTLSWRQGEKLRSFRETSIKIASTSQKVKKRFIEWQVATRFAQPQERAFATGYGPGNYQGNIGSLYGYDSTPNEEKMPPDSNNLWMVQTMSTGVLGLGALLWVIIHFFGLAWRNRSHWLGAGVIGSLSSWIFVNFFHASLVRGAGLVMAFLFALAVVAASNQTNTSTVNKSEK